MNIKQTALGEPCLNCSQFLTECLSDEKAFFIKLSIDSKTSILNSSFENHETVTCFQGKFFYLLLRVKSFRELE